MKLFFRLFGLWLLLGCASAAWSQTTGPKIDRVDIKFVGPASVSEQFVRANIRLKAGDIYHPNNTEDDVRMLYATRQFSNIRVAVDVAEDGGVILTYIVQVRPRITEIKLEGNKKLSSSKLRKKITVKVGDPLDELKLFTDAQEMQKLYEKYGHPDTQVKYIVNTDENTGRSSVTFEISETPKVKITRIDFIGAAVFSQKELRKQLKTKERWMWSWLTGRGTFKQDDYEADRDGLVDFYRNHGYLDFEIRDVKFDHPATNRLVIKFYVFEGRQYKVGAVTFSGTTIFPTNAVSPAFNPGPEPKPKNSPAHAAWLRSQKLNRDFTMKTGSVFTPDGLNKDTKAVQDFYGSQGYIEVAQGQALRVARVPNVDTGTMDLAFQVDEGQKSYVEKIEIRGNSKTKDKVIRRELAIAPGEVFDMVRVEVSKQRLENLQYFDKVDLRPEPTEPLIAGRKNLIVNVEEQNTGKLTFGAGFSSVDALVGYGELTQGNFDLFHPPTFTGGGQKFRLFVQLGTLRQDYIVSFIEPWFLNRKLSLGVDLYRHQLDFESPNNIFNETRTGMKLSLTRALGSDFLIGSVSYTIEDIGISLNGGWHNGIYRGGNPPSPPNVPQAILDETGDHFYQRFGASLAYDTRNSTKLPNHGQRSELDTELSTGDKTFYTAEVKSEWFFPGLFSGHVLEAVGRAGVAESLGSGDVPFYDRYYLGGLYSLRGFKYRNIGPRDPLYHKLPTIPDEPIGGDSYWFGSLEYSIPILEKEDGVGVRFALFYDVGSVGAGSYKFSGNFDDNWGVGFHLNIPHLGPLRLEYGVPIHHDQYNGAGGQFQFGVGWERPF
ncbi:MAG: outer membrane protein assembly factor BamA [Verrucomicrobiota bacterium]|jgi:outer membrane protein insertion porin family